MSKFQNYLKTFDITSTLTEEDIDKTLALLQIYGPAVRRTASRIGEMEEECYEGRRQSISDFINLAIDYDRDIDRKRIADRLAEMGHSMQLLSVMEDALVLVKDTPPNGGTYFNILQARYFDVYCTSNEEAYLNLGISSSTYYRHIKPAIRAYAASLWCAFYFNTFVNDLKPPKKGHSEKCPFQTYNIIYYFSVRYPSGFIDCHFQESAHISLIPFSATHPSSSLAFVASQ